MVSPAAAAAGGGKKSRYDEDNLPTPATLVADLKEARNFKSAITDMDDDGSGAPLPYLGYLVFACADEVHEDDENQYIFATSRGLAEAISEEESEVVDVEADEGDMGAEAIAEVEFEVIDPAADEGDMGAEATAEAEFELDDPAADQGDLGAEAYGEIALGSRAQLTALKQHVLKRRVFYVLIRADRRQYADPDDEDMSSDVILLAMGVSPATGNLVGVIAIQAYHNLCD
ncbi:unnamed protein product [Ectocarpus sp. CCAP 1310/34]|nr:unnamed protein product [Ectocarpus sp. CCAP 1310/34]